MTLTRAQREVLTLLRDNGPMPTSRTTAHGCVSGVCFTGLERRGLAERISSWRDSGWEDDLGPRVRITVRGRAELGKAKGMK